MNTYPISLVHLDRVRSIVVGGGKIAARKVTGLLAAGARVVVISPVLCDRLEDVVASGDIEVTRRAYRPGDLQGAFLVIAATNDPATNEHVWEEAQQRGILINVVDDRAHCAFIAPAVVRRGALAVAISTSGRCPAFSRHLRERLESEFGPAYEPFLDLLGELRERVLDVLPFDRRNAVWDQVFRSDVLDLLASGDEAAARRRTEEILHQNLSESI